jgi:hypothetical protein
MKTYSLLFIVIAAFAGFFISGCEPAGNTVPGDDARDPFIGMWQFIEAGKLKSTEGQSYVVSITKDPDNSTQVILKNFGNPGSENITVIGIVTANQIVVSKQDMTNGWKAEGVGKFSNVAKTSMSWTYKLTIGPDEEYFTANASLQ